jgi:subtilisin family serine protease
VKAPRNWLRARAFLLAGALVTAGILATVALGAGGKISPAPNRGALKQAGTATFSTSKDVSPRSKAAPTKNGLSSVIVKLRVTSVASYTGDVRGYAPTSSLATKKPFTLNTEAAQRYLSYVNSRIDSFANGVSVLIPRSQVLNRYDVVLGGVSMLVPTDQIDSLKQFKDVEQVIPDQLVQPDTENSPSFIGATNFWANNGIHRGQGVIVGIIDTGIWPEHPSFSNPDSSGIPYPPPHGTRSGVRTCQFSGGANPGPAFLCNNKLISAYRSLATYDALIGLTPAEYSSARDSEGHGSHTASTSAGNFMVASSVFGVSRGNVSGIAPRAHVSAYKALGLQGGFSSDLANAIQRSIADGVDVINYSISGGGSPYADAAELAFLDAYNAGVFVSTSAGNSGPAAETVAHRSPWVTTVAASTQNREFRSTLILGSSDGSTMQVQGTTIAPSRSPAPVVSAADPPYNDALCQNGTADGAFTGKIVLCARGVNGRIQKGFNVKNRGAIGMILYNTGLTTDVETDNHFLPATHIQPAEGTAVNAFFHAHPNVQATWNTGSAQPSQGDVMAAFSSRGGPLQSLGVSKPDVTAPGVQILAATSPTPDSVDAGAPGQLFQAIAGTSMSSPHVAGAGALLKELHPTWTPGQIRSALMTTAKIDVVKEDFVTHADPFDDGSGRIDLNKAGDPGITFDAPGSDYLTFRDQLFRTNYPSVYVPNMPGIVTVQRTLHDVTGSNSAWSFGTASQRGMTISVSPSSVTMPANGNATINITINASGLPAGAVRFGGIKMTGSGNSAVMPVTIVRGQGPVSFTKGCTPTSLALNQSTHCTLTATNTTAQVATVDINDQLPSNLSIVPASITGATQNGNGVTFQGSLPATTPPQINYASCAACSPGGYLELAAFGIPKIAISDDQVVNFSTPAFTYGGETYTQLGVSSNGLVRVGGGTAADATPSNTNFPNPANPNNVIAPFWTDLNPAAALAADGVRIGVLTDGQDTWIVVDWDNVPEFSTLANKHSFEIWLGVNNDAHPAEDNTVAFGPSTGNGDAGFLTAGAENRLGNNGNSVYFNGAGTLPATNSQYLVTGSAPVAAAPKVITFDAVGTLVGSWQNCATMTSNQLFGTAVSCVSGDVH